MYIIYLQNRKTIYGTSSSAGSAWTSATHRPISLDRLLCTEECIEAPHSPAHSHTMSYNVIQCQTVRTESTEAHAAQPLGLWFFCSFLLHWHGCQHGCQHGFQHVFLHNCQRACHMLSLKRDLQCVSSKGSSSVSKRESINSLPLCCSPHRKAEVFLDPRSPGQLCRVQLDNN